MIPPAAFNAANVVIIAAIIFGVIVHRKRLVHARIMTTCFIADVLMVLLIEIQRKAIEQAVGPTSALMRFHIAVSVAALVLWVPQILTGRADSAGRTAASPPQDPGLDFSSLPDDERRDGVHGQPVISP